MPTPKSERLAAGVTNAKKGWIEFKKTGNKRLARRRYWLKEAGQWVKSTPIRERTIPTMTEPEYLAWKERHERVKKALQRFDRTPEQKP